jgi:multiple sugar transport system substrate-binding protein
MRQLTRRHVLVALATLAAMPKGARAQAPSKLSASYSTNAFDELMASIASLYEKRSGTEIAYRHPVAPTHDDHLKQTLLWAVTRELPDLSFQANNHIRRLVRMGLAKPLGDLALRDEEWSHTNSASAVSQIGRVSGNLYGLPFQVSVPICIINLDLVARAGADPNDLPGDWPGLLDLARRINALGGDTMGGFFDFGGAWTFQALITAQGGSMATADERAVAFTGNEGLAAMEIIRGFGEAGMVDLTQVQGMQAFAAGTIGILATSNNVFAGLERQSRGRFKIGAAAWPLPSASGKLPAGGRTGVIFTEDRARQAGAWRFLRFVTEPDVQAIVVKATGAIPVDATESYFTSELRDFYRAHPSYAAALSSSNALTGWYSYPGENTVRIVEVMIDYLRAVVARKKTPDVALRELGHDVQALIGTD